MRYFKASDHEEEAMAAVERAIKALPPSIYIETDEDEGELQFWKRTPNGAGDAEQVGVMRAKRRVAL